MIRFFKSKHFPEFSNNFTQIRIILINKNDATFKFLWDLYNKLFFSSDYRLTLQLLDR